MRCQTRLLCLVGLFTFLICTSAAAPIINTTTVTHSCDYRLAFERAFVHTVGEGTLAPRMDTASHAGLSHIGSQVQWTLFPSAILGQFVDEGRLVTQWEIDATIDELDANLRLSPIYGPDPFDTKWQRVTTFHSATAKAGWEDAPCELDAEFRNNWSTILRALGELWVGRTGKERGEKEVWTMRRRVNTGLLDWRDPAASEGPNAPRMKTLGDGWVQYLGPPGTQQGIGAYYHWVLNALDGVIVAQEAVSPEEELSRILGRPATRNELSAVNKWSDHIWFTWANLHTVDGTPRIPGAVSGGRTKSVYADMLQNTAAAHGALKKLNFNSQSLAEMRAFLNYVVVQNVNHKETLHVVASCLKARGEDLAEGSPRPVWNSHQSYQLGHWCFYALLAQPSGQSVAWLLIQHKTEKALGLKRLRSVTIFFGDPVADGSNSESSSFPTLVWEVVDAGSKPLELLKDLSE
ncbi:hypothetical protein LTR86_005119 [Recurvomyces mirabilis]|nr:hypothetical protein LTR86_005119 [Recurvomyces mirabilis]